MPTAHRGFDSISHRLVIQHALLLLQAAALPSGHPSVFKYRDYFFISFFFLVIFIFFFLLNPV